MDDPYSRQVGGTHYQQTGMQPNHFTMTNGWNGQAHSVVKYLSRHNLPGGKGRVDVEKADHFVDFLIVGWGPHLKAPRFAIRMGEYLQANPHISPPAATVLYLLEDVLLGYEDAAGSFETMKRHLRDLLGTYAETPIERAISRGDDFPREPVDDDPPAGPSIEPLPMVPMRIVGPDEVPGMADKILGKPQQDAAGRASEDGGFDNGRDHPPEEPLRIEPAVVKRGPGRPRKDVQRDRPLNIADLDAEANDLL